MNNKKKCFVIMPFSETDSLVEEKWTEIFEHIIKPTVEESRLGYECKRYGLGRANIVKDILEDLNRAQVVIADLTDDNPNVLWELGVRHVLKRRTLLISQDTEFIPSDLKDYPVIPYDQTKAGFDKFKEDIKRKLKDIEADPDKPDSPVADFLQLKNIDILASEKKANLAKLTALISEVSYNANEADLIINQVKQVQKRRKKEQQTKPYATPVRLSNNCLQLLVTTEYILFSQELLNSVARANRLVGLVNRSLDLWRTYGKDVEKRLLTVLPKFKNDLIDLLKEINQVKLDYANDNYIGPETPTVLLASPEHGEYLKLGE